MPVLVYSECMKSRLAHPLLSLFDVYKKKRMEETYATGSRWGRKTINPDIEAAVALIEDRHYGRCLDIGTGEGYYAEAVAPFCDEVIGIDISEVAIERARKRLASLPNVQLQAVGIRDFDFNQKFDLIILGDVLYYFGDKYFPEAFKGLLQQIAGVVTPDGRILISTYFSTGVSEETARLYVTLFAQCGLHIEYCSVFNDGRKNWLHTLLSKS